MIETSRCTGHCCKNFTMPDTPRRYEQDYRTYLNWAADQTKPEPDFKDIHIIGPMLIHLGHGFYDKKNSVFVPDKEQGGHYYTCRHFDVPSGNCLIHDVRPAMCRDFPYGGPCPFPGCTRKVEDAKEDKKAEGNVGGEERVHNPAKDDTDG